MNNISRRWFLGGALTATAVVTVPLARLVPLAPSIFADGIHDDTAGLQALFEGKPCNLLSDAVQLVHSECVEITGGKYRIAGTIRVTDDMRVTLRDMFFLRLPNDDKDKPFLFFPSGASP